MPKQITRYLCLRCNTEHETMDKAKDCEARHGKLYDIKEEVFVRFEEDENNEIRFPVQIRIAAELGGKRYSVTYYLVMGAGIQEES